MATQIQRRRGTTAQHSTFTGAAGELTVDTDKKTVVVHDGSTAGGVPLLRENGSQNAVTTGTSTAASFIPTSSSVPTNGVYLPAANSVAISTNGSGRLFVDSSGRVGVGTNVINSLFEARGTSDGQNIIHLSNNAGSTDGGATNVIRFTCNGNTNWGNARYDAFAHIWNTNGSERLRLDSAGRLGIGSSTPGTNTSNSANQLVVGDNTNAAERGITIGSTTACGIRFNDGADAGLIEYIHSSDAMRIVTNGAEAFRVDSSRRVLVGTSSSSGVGKFVVQGNTSAGDGLAILSYWDQSPGSGTPIGALGFTDADNTKFAAWIRTERDGGTWSSTSKPGRLVFSVTTDGSASPVERARISNTGRFQTHTTSSNGHLFNTSRTATSTEDLVGFTNNSSDTGGGTLCAAVRVNGNLVNTNNSYGSLSDIKLKENIVDATSQWEDLKALQVRKYNFKAETGQETHTQIGLIAQEVEQVSPGLVSESPDRDAEGNDLGTVTKSVNYSVLYMKAVKALQEAMERIETLEAKVAALEAA